MTNRNITQNNLYLILPGKIAGMATMYSNEFGVPLTEAIRKIYSSSTYKKLEDEKSKLWHQGPVALYETLLDDIG